MLTRIRIRNFKKLGEATLDLDAAVVFAGPNNSGKTSALQAIALWELGVRKWAGRRASSKGRPGRGIAINRRDLLAAPVPSALQLWKDLHVRESVTSGKTTKPSNVRIEIEVEGKVCGKQWRLGLEFDYANPESFYCRLLRGHAGDDISAILKSALQERIGFLPPMSGLATEEDLLQSGSISGLIGEGRTAEVLRNLCYIIWRDHQEKWEELTKTMQQLFRTQLDPPRYDEGTGKITMTYREGGKARMDLSNTGRGFQQTLLLFSFIYARPNHVLLLDEPDAHLEIIRQRENYRALVDLVRRNNSQLIVATHSEVVIGEAAQDDRIIAFIGKPHVVNDQQQLVKALTTIGFDQYLLAEQKGWVLYLEGSSDLSILQAAAKLLGHPAAEYLREPFVKYVANIPADAETHFHGLREAVKSLRGVALFDRVDTKLKSDGLLELMWARREIENYIPLPETLYRFVERQPSDLFVQHDEGALREIVEDIVPRAALRDRADDWWMKTKVSDDFLDKALRQYARLRHCPILLNKRDYYRLIEFAQPSEIDREVISKLDAIARVAKSAAAGK